MFRIAMFCRKALAGPSSLARVHGKGKIGKKTRISTFPTHFYVGWVGCSQGFGRKEMFLEVASWLFTGDKKESKPKSLQQNLPLV